MKCFEGTILPKLESNSTVNILVLSWPYGKIVQIDAKLAQKVPHLYLCPNEPKFSGSSLYYVQILWSNLLSLWSSFIKLPALPPHKFFNFLSDSQMSPLYPPYKRQIFQFFVRFPNKSAESSVLQTNISIFCQIPKCILCIKYSHLLLSNHIV